MTKRIIAYDKLDPIEGVIIRKTNPSFYNKPRANFDAVYAPSYPKIEADYKGYGVEVFRPEGVEQAKPEEKPVEAPVAYVEPVSAPTPSEDTPEEEVSSEEPTEAQEEEGQSDWRELSWPQLRSLAAQHSDEPIRSKDQAIETLEEAEQAGKL